jgi:hypothetical protein
VVVVAAYVASVVMYANSATWHHQQDVAVPAEGDRTTATLTVEDIQSNYNVLVATWPFHPGLH